LTRVVALIGDPVDHSLSPRMQNAAFAAVALDWTYVALRVRADELADAIRGLTALGFAGANVTAPHKTAVAELVGANLPSVNTLLVRDGAIEASSTDAAILDGLQFERAAILGDGGSASAFAHALPDAERFSRRADWPPRVDDVDLVVNATSARDDILVELHEGQTLVDLPYPRTATAVAAAERGAAVVDGLDVLVAQGAASFVRWTGVSAPVDVMHAAVRSA
jgi:shikimate dehydrogenase